METPGAVSRRYWPRVIPGNPNEGFTVGRKSVSLAFGTFVSVGSVKPGRPTALGLTAR